MCFLVVPLPWKMSCLLMTFAYFYIEVFFPLTESYLLMVNIKNFTQLLPTARGNVGVLWVAGLKLLKLMDSLLFSSFHFLWPQVPR